MKVHTKLQRYQQAVSILLEDAAEDCDEREREALHHYVHMRASIVLGPQIHKARDER